MHNQDHVTRGQHPVARTLRIAERPVLRWLRLIGTLALAFAITGTSYAVLAQDDPKVKRSWRTWMEPVGPKSIEICLKQTASITVQIQTELKEETTTTTLWFLEDTVVEKVKAPKLAVKIGARADSDIVKVLSATEYTSSKSVPYGTATFKVSGEKEGETSVYFSAVILDRRPAELLDGPIGTNVVDTRVSVKVVNCKYVLSAVSGLYVPGPALLAVVATIHKAEIICIEGKCTGDADVWYGGAVTPVRDCSGTVKIEKNKANVVGTMSDKGVLSLTLTYAPTTATFNVNCKGIKGSESVQITASPVTVIAFREGLVAMRRPQKIAPGGAGYVNISVRPVK